MACYPNLKLLLQRVGKLGTDEMRELSKDREFGNSLNVSGENAENDNGKKHAAWRLGDGIA